MGKFRSTAFISFALPCTTVNAGGGVTAVRTVPRGYSDDGTLGGLGLGIQTTQSAGGGAFPEESRVKLLRTFSTVVPFPRPFSIMMSSSTLF